MMDRTSAEVLSGWQPSPGPPLSTGGVLLASDTFQWQHNATTTAGGILAPTAATPARHIGLTTEVVLTVCYAVGIAGNLAALVILTRGGRRAHRNRRHSLMLRCLACNDLVALLGMLLMMEAQLRLPVDLVHSRFFCSLRVVWRLFGLGSGSVALVMAMERWLALTRPFFYHKHVTYHVVRRAIFSMWSCVLLLVLLPLAGFGLYYDPVSCTCARYPRATKPADIAYAYVYFTFGMLLIASILCCNLLVARGLNKAGHSSWGRVRCDHGHSTKRHRGLGVLALLGGSESTAAGKGATTPKPSAIIRRISRNCSRQRDLRHADSLIDSATHTHEESAFAKLMGFLCVLFVLCWLPQMIAIPLTQQSPTWGPGKRFVRVADFSLLLHFTLDPFVYVLQRCTRRRHHAQPPPALGSAIAGAAAASVQPLLHERPPPTPTQPQPAQPQSFVKKLGASLRLCGAEAACLCCRSDGKASDMQLHSTCSTATATASTAPRLQVLPECVAL